MRNGVSSQQQWSVSLSQILPYVAQWKHVFAPVRTSQKPAAVGTICGAPCCIPAIALREVHEIWHRWDFSQLLPAHHTYDLLSPACPKQVRFGVCEQAGCALQHSVCTCKLLVSPVADLICTCPMVLSSGRPAADIALSNFTLQPTTFRGLGLDCPLLQPNCQMLKSS